MTGSRPWWRWTRRERPADVAALSAPRPIDRHRPVRAAGAEPAVRVLLFGSGPASGWGVRQQDHGLGGGIARSLAARTGRATTVEFLVDDHWEEHDAPGAIRAQRLADYDAVVVISAYRRAMLAVPPNAWRQYVDELRDMLILEAGAEGVIQILALPWRDAAARAPRHWGGAFGDAVVGVAEAAEDSVREFRVIDFLELTAPPAATEWIGPSFSRETYAAWGAETAARLAPRLPQPDALRPRPAGGTR